MTREQRHKHYCLPEHVSQMDKIEKIIWEVIEDCHDDFESRICENCKYLSSCGKQCNNEEVGKMVDENNLIVHSMIVYKDFGCLKFERKEV